MKRINTAVLKFGSAIASIVLLFGVISTQPTCLLWYHQPKVPQGMKNLKK